VKEGFFMKSWKEWAFMLSFLLLVAAMVAFEAMKN